uniref:Uncharacterized protein n=1 Tax=Arion vulgaris TaxID=1028688 RepID=A0A0B6ZRJ9_9EUPU
MRHSTLLTEIRSNLDYHNNEGNKVAEIWLKIEENCYKKTGQHEEVKSTIHGQSNLFFPF